MYSEKRRPKKRELMTVWGRVLTLSRPITQLHCLLWDLVSTLMSEARTTSDQRKLMVQALDHTHSKVALDQRYLQTKRRRLPSVLLREIGQTYPRMYQLQIHTILTSLLRLLIITVSRNLRSQRTLNSTKLVLTLDQELMKSGKKVNRRDWPRLS